MSPHVKQPTPTARDHRVITRMEDDFIAAARRRLVDGLPIAKVVKYLEYAAVAIDEKKADLGILPRCPACHSPVTEPVFDPEHSFLTVEAFFPRWCSEVCRDVDLARRRERAARAAKRAQRKAVA